MISECQISLFFIFLMISSPLNNDLSGFSINNPLALSSVFVLTFVLSRKTIDIYNDIAQKYGNVTVKDFRKYEKLEYKKKKKKKKKAKIRHQRSQQLQTTWRVSEISYF